VTAVAVPGRRVSFPSARPGFGDVALLRDNAHWQLQDDILSMPGLALDFVGRVETFDRDIVRVLDHICADRSWPLYYTQGLADRVYAAYESDFDRFGYARIIPSAPTM
jgi:hypothetical protein